jgi:rhamnulokinase
MPCGQVAKHFEFTIQGFQKQMMPKNNYIAIDLGAGSGRIMLGILHGMKLEMNEVHRFDHNVISVDGFMKWDWNLIKKEIFTGLKKSCDFVNEENITSISCDSWAQDFGLLDRDGNLIFSPVSYRDARTKGMPEKISETISPAELHRRNGSSLSPMTSLCQLKAMAVTMPEILKNAATILHMANLVHFELCGTAVSDWTMATASQLWNIGNDEWDFELLDMLGIPSQFLPDIVRKPEIIGKVNPEKAPHKKLSGVPVVSAAGHDTASAAAILYPLEKGTLFLSLGTWAMLGCSVGTEFNPTDYPDGDDMCFLGLPYGKWGVFRGNSGLWAIQECRKEWSADGMTISWDELSKNAAHSRIETIIDITDKSLFAPPKMTAVIAELCRKTGQAVPVSPGDYMRIICHSLAVLFREDIRKISEFTGYSFDKLYIVGGGISNAFLCDVIGAETGLKIIKGPSEASAAGNILMQAIASGAVKTDDEIKKVAAGFFSDKGAGGRDTGRKDS